MKNIILPKPQTEMFYPLMAALKNRRTVRKWKTEPLSMQEISNILWCACGETKEACGKSKNKRTIPSGCNSQLVSVYAAMEQGVYRYSEHEHKLIQISEDDVRGDIGTQEVMKSAPFGIIYVADYCKKTGIIKTDNSEKKVLSGTEAGSMSQNVYLYCAAAGLNTVLLGLVARDKLGEKLMLCDSCEIIYTQVVGKDV